MARGFAVSCSATLLLLGAARRSVPAQHENMSAALEQVLEGRPVVLPFASEALNEWAAAQVRKRCGCVVRVQRSAKCVCCGQAAGDDALACPSAAVAHLQDALPSVLHCRSNDDVLAYMPTGLAQVGMPPQV